MTRLDEIRARLAAANPGRWVAEGPILYVVEVDETPEADEIRSLFVDVGSKADAALIANAPADLAYLLAEVERLTPHETEDTADIATAVAQMQAEIAQLKAEVQRLQAGLPALLHEGAIEPCDVGDGTGYRLAAPKEAPKAKRRGLTLPETDAIRKALGLSEDAGAEAILDAAKLHATMIAVAKCDGVDWRTLESGTMVVSWPRSEGESLDEIRALLGSHCPKGSTVKDAVCALVTNYEETSEILGEHKAGIAGGPPKGWSAIYAHPKEKGIIRRGKDGTWDWVVWDAPNTTPHAQGWTNELPQAVVCVETLAGVLS